MRVLALTERPIPRREKDGRVHYYIYRLSEGSIDLSRVKAGTAQIDLYHDRRRPVGTMSGTEVNEKGLWIDLGFWEDTEESRAFKARYESGRMRGVSVEAEPISMSYVDPQTTSVDKWLLTGVALTNEPADEHTQDMSGEPRFTVHLSNDDAFKEVVNMANEPANEPAKEEQIEQVAEKIGDNVFKKIIAFFKTEAESESNPNEPKVEDQQASGQQSTEQPQVAQAQQSTETPPENASPQATPPGTPPTQTTQNLEPVSVMLESTSPERIHRMADIAAEQKRYDAEKVRELELDALSEGKSAKEFMHDLSTIVIHPNPIAPNKSSEQDYDLGKAIVSVLRNDPTLAPYERAVSNDIHDLSQMDSPPDAMAIPMAEVRKHDLTTIRGATPNDGNVIAASATDVVTMIREDVPDPLDILGLVTRVPSTPGDSKIARVNVPPPQMVGEPTVEYSETGTADMSSVTLTPHFLVGRYNVARTAGTAVPNMLQQFLNVGMARILEQQNLQVVRGNGTGHEVRGIYGLPMVGSTATENLAAYTAAAIRAALDQSYAMREGGNRRIIVDPQVYTALEDIASPQATARLMENGMIRDVPVIQSRAVGGTAKPFRGVAGPFTDCYMKQWDDAIFVSSRYAAGVTEFTIELFWDIQFGHPNQWYNFTQA